MIIQKIKKRRKKGKNKKKGYDNKKEREAVNENYRLPD
jgi:hypothetical protein